MNCKKCGKEIPEGREYCADCEREIALADMAAGTQNNVSDGKKGLSKKAIGIIIAVCAVVLIAVVTLIIVFSNKNDSGNEPSSIREYVSFYTDESGNEKQVIVTEKVPAEEGKIDNENNQNIGNNDNVNTPVTKKPTTTVPAENPNKIGNEVKEDKVKVESKVQNSLTAFFSGKFYYDGVMYDRSGETTRMKIAVSGNDLEAIMYDSGMGVNMGVMQLDGKTYIVNTDKKEYIEFTKELGDMFGINTEDLKFDDLSKMFSSRSSEPDAQYSTTVNGKDATCYEYVSSDKSTMTKFYFVGKDLVELDQTDSDGAPISQTMINEFSYSIPSDMLTLNGLNKASSIMNMLQ